MDLISNPDAPRNREVRRTMYGPGGRGASNPSRSSRNTHRDESADSFAFSRDASRELSSRKRLTEIPQERGIRSSKRSRTSLRPGGGSFRASQAGRGHQSSSSLKEEFPETRNRRGTAENLEALQNASRQAQRVREGRREGRERFNTRFRESSRRVSKKFYFEDEENLISARTICIYLLVALITVTLAIFVPKYLTFNKVTYCDTNEPDREKMKNCTICPQGAYCNDGKITSCANMFVMSGGICINDSKAEKRLIQTVQKVANSLSALHGRALCSPKTEYKKNGRWLENSIQNSSISKSWQNMDTQRVIYNIKRGDYDGFGLKTKDGDRGDFVVYSTKPTPGFSCSIKLIVLKNKIFSVLASIALGLIVYFTLTINARLKKLNKARIAYQKMQKILREQPNGSMLKEDVIRKLRSRGIIDQDEEYVYLIEDQMLDGGEVGYLHQEVGGVVKYRWYIVE